jgi:hypothetical protein
MPHNNGLVPRINVNHSPRPGWSVKRKSSSRIYVVNYTGLLTEISIGSRISYVYKDGTNTIGLGRSTSVLPKLKYEPTDWSALFGGWAEVIYPTALAESGSNFLVINAWDKAGLTLGFIQLAAHTNDDLILFFKRLVLELPVEMGTWFPEIGVENDRVVYKVGNDFRYLDVQSPPIDGIAAANYYRSLFMHFFNPNRRAIDAEELQAAGRWIAWTLESADMRRIQVAHSIENMKDSAKKLHKAILANAATRTKFPQGIDGMRGDIFAAAIAVPHLSPTQMPVAIQCLAANDILDAFAASGYGPGTRARTVVSGVRARGVALSRLRYDMARENFF